MSLTNVKSGWQRRFFVSKREPAFGTAAAMNFVFDTPGSHAPLRVEQERETDADLARGVEGPTQEFYLEKHCDRVVPMRLSPEALGLFAANCLGADAVTGTTAFQHKITPVAAGTFPGSLSIEEHASGTAADSDTDKALLGMAVKSIELSYEDKGWVMLNVELFGSGKSAAATSPTEASMVGRSLYFPVNKINVSVKAEATEHQSSWAGTFAGETTPGAFSGFAGYTSIGKAIKKLSAKWDNAYTDELSRRAGGSSAAGIIREQPRGSVRRGTLDFECYTSDTTKALIYAALAGTQSNNVEYSVVIECISDLLIDATKLYCFVWAFPLMRFVNTPSGSQGMGYQSDRYSLEAKWPTAGTVTDPIQIISYDGQSAEYDSTPA